MIRYEIRFCAKGTAHDYDTVWQVWMDLRSREKAVEVARWEQAKGRHDFKVVAIRTVEEGVPL